MKNTEQLCINTIRVLSAEAIQQANSGHPGLPMGAAPMAFTVWNNHMEHNPQNPNWANRDRFILSAGHGSMLIYSLLYMFGYGLTIEDLKGFRQWGTKTPGHPEYGHTAGVETTTGPLGQGMSNAVGMAMAEAYLAERFNRPGYNILDNYIYTLVGDGCMMEGITSEAASLAGTLGLDKLIVLYDSNSISIEGDTDIAFREDVAKRFEAYNWHVIEVEDGNDTAAINKAIEEAKSQKDKPSFIKITTQIGYGCPTKQGKASAHGEPLGEENIKCTKEYLNWESDEPFYVPQEVISFTKEAIRKGKEQEDKWNKLFEEYKRKYPELAEQWEAWHNNELPVDLLNDDSFWSFEDKPMATRVSSGEVINRIAKVIPNLIGGSADLSPSNKTIMKERGDFLPEDKSGSNLHFGVREHAMSAIANGMALYGGLHPYCATFFVFSDYMRGGMRLSALMGLPVVYVLTHDSIGVGEDGPTHQPVEHIAALRCMPNFITFRPADAKEVAAGWLAALTRKDAPTALILTRQNVPLYKESGKDALKGAYILADSEKETPDMILMATGSEVELIYKARTILKQKGIDARVVSMPSFELFEEQDEEYKNSVLPKDVEKRLAVEAGVDFGWHKYLGSKGDIISINRFGASGNVKTAFEKFGFTVENVIEHALKL
jgi:transketolase